MKKNGMKLSQLLSQGVSSLAFLGEERARLEARSIVQGALHCNASTLYEELDLEESLVELIQSRFARRAKYEPIGYIEGSKEFMGLLLKVNRDVLIPRQETEILVEKIISYLQNLEKKESLKGKRFCDLCTGSGCIALAIKRHFPSLEVEAIDISAKALQIAKENGKLHNIEVHWKEGDLVAPLEGVYDFIACNPPYIATEVIPSLEKEVIDFEPWIALDGREDGLWYYRKLATDLLPYTKKGTKIWFEIGHDQAASLLPLFSHPWTLAQIQQDWSGNDRFFFLERE